MSNQENNDKWRYQTINGLNGIQIRKFVKFLFGCKAPYEWDTDQKTFAYMVPSEMLENENYKNLKQRFEKHFMVIIKPYYE
jgi:hypothetical protein